MSNRNQMENVYPGPGPVWPLKFKLLAAISYQDRSEFLGEYLLCSSTIQAQVFLRWLKNFGGEERGPEALLMRGTFRSRQLPGRVLNLQVSMSVYQTNSAVGSNGPIFPFTKINDPRYIGTHADLFNPSTIRTIRGQE
jgi:hypothetical protein